MKSDNPDILEMLDVLNLPVAVKTFQTLQKSPEFGHYSALQLIRELLTPQYLETLNKRYETNLNFSGVIDKRALIENLKTGNGRIYNDTTVEQILNFNFAEERLNVGVYGVTGAGKSYFLSACCVEACRLNFRGRFVDYCELLDELIMLKRQGDMKKYRKRLRYYARMQLLFIDDFAISRYSEEGMNILYQLVKMRADLGTSTLYSSQYAPDEWGQYLSDEPKCYEKLDGIRRRLTTGFTAEASQEICIDSEDIIKMAFRFCASFSNVAIILSGMNNKTVVEENCKIFRNISPLTKDEFEQVAVLRESLKKKKAVQCTFCQYCKEQCPVQMPIPELIAAYNSKIMFKGWNSKLYYNAIISDGKKPSECIGCGLCEKRCPQHLKIRNILKNITGSFEKKK